VSRTIFVSGATGVTGRATVRALLAKGAKVVAGVHSSEKASALAALGAIAKPFDLAKVDAMADAMRGADGLYLVTPASERTEALTWAMLEAAKSAGIGHVAKLSGLGVDQEPSVAFMRWHLAAEQAIRGSGLAWTFLRPTSFIQNFYGAIPIVKAQGIYFNAYKSAPIAFVDAQDIGEVAAAVLLSDDHIGRIVNLTGPRGVDADEVTRLLSAAAGKSITRVDVGGDQLAEAFAGFGMSPMVAAATAELLGRMAMDKAGVVSSDIEALLGRPPRDFTQWVEENAEAFR
jgi:uncharacterized protein YbjT (DUF2867 family)